MNLDFRRLIPNRAGLVSISAAVVVAGAFFTIRSQPQTIEVVELKKQDVDSTLLLTGRIEPLRDVSVSSTSSPSVIESLFVDLGIRVKKGDTLALLDSSEILGQIAEAEAGLAQAEAQLSQTKVSLESSRSVKNLRSAELELSLELKAAEDQAKDSIASAKARVDKSSARLARLQKGGRAEDVAKASANLKAAEANEVQKAQELSRQQRLYESGAVPRKDMDSAKLLHAEARARLESARQDLESLSSARPEDIEEAEADLAEAKAALAAGTGMLKRAEKALKERIGLRIQAQSSSNEVLANQESVRVAAVNVRTRKALLAQMKARLAKTIIKSPIDGIVTRINSYEGDVAATGGEILRITSEREFRAVADVDERLVGSLSVGQSALLRIDADPDKAISGTISAIGEEGSQAKGTVSVRFKINDKDVRLKPDLTVNISVLTKKYRSSILVPNSAVMREEGSIKAVVFQDGKGKVVELTVEATDEKGIVVSNLSQGTLVAMDPRSVQLDKKLKVKGGQKAQ